MDYKTGYEQLYRELAIYMETQEEAFKRLKQVQVQLEEMYVTAPPAPIQLAKGRAKIKKTSDERK